MATGIIHEEANVKYLKYSVLFNITVGAITQDIFSTVILTISSLLGCMFTPDQDLQDNIGHTFLPRLIKKYIIHSNSLYIFLCKLSQVFWSPYSTLIEHRSIISHSIVLSTVIRFLYICLVIVLILTLLQVNVQLLFMYAINNINPIYLFYLLFNWCIQDIIHLYLDDLLFIKPNKVKKRKK